MVGDAGLPVPAGVRCVDLAVALGVPPLLDVLRAIASELAVAAITVADELLDRDTDLPAALQPLFPSAAFASVPHAELKAIGGHARAIIRTGESTPYANVVLRSGVAF